MVTYGYLLKLKKIKNLEITNVTPNTGSIFGNSTVRITGKYLYHSDLIPANIDIAGFSVF